jgi:hypothetical protein
VPSAPRVHRPVPAMNLPNNSSELEMGHTHDEHGSHHDEPNHGDVPH